MNGTKTKSITGKQNRCFMVFSFFIFGMLVVLFFLPQPSSADNDIQISGDVYTIIRNEEEPVTTVEVIIYLNGSKMGNSLEVNSETGHFERNGLPEGYYEVHVEDEKYKKQIWYVNDGQYVTKTPGSKRFLLDPKPWDMILEEKVMEDYVLQGIGLIGIVCFFISLPIGYRIKKTREIENNIPDVLTEVAANIRSANSVESSFRDVAMVRNDYTGRLLKVTCKRMNETSFSQAMEEFALKSKSLAVKRIVSLINIAIESGASIADVLDKISDELASLYALRREKENKSATNAVIVLWGGVIFTPGIIGFILGFFNSAADIPLGDASYIIQIFMVFFAAECAIMHAAAMGSMKMDMIRAPFYMFLAQLIYVVTLYASPALM